MFNIPILLITFNRADHVRRILAEIRKQHPTELYIAQDGPREGNESDILKVQQVREVINESVDWHCNLHTLYQKKNLGCGPGPYTAISWFFENVDKGIILEDDLQPHPYFFSYCSNLLAKYENDERVGLITAHNQQRIYTEHNSFYFTFNMSGTLGWATWKRVWENFDFNIKYNECEFDTLLKRFYHLPKPYRDYEKYHYRIWMQGSRQDVWDHQFKYFLLTNGYLDAKPNSCLVSHLGIDADATHTGFTDSGYLMDIKEHLFQVIEYPKEIKVDKAEIRRSYIKSLKILVKRFLGLVKY